MSKKELLAPVGSMESLYAAVANGADAVYLGGEMFSARKHATNFNNEELKEAVRYAHLNGVCVHVAVNILLDDKEVMEALDYIKYLYEIDVDAIIVQDIGLASLVLQAFPDFPIHGSTQMTINNLEGAKYLEELGFTRVVLARETPFDEIKRIKENTSLEVEVFVHGALCVAYSGQCLMSSLIGGRSGNRGNCAQPCRMAYSIVDKNEEVIDGWEESYVLSTKDLNTIDNIEDLINIGVDSFKIEGRMKRPEYVATIVKNYRKAIDEGSKTITTENKKEMKQIFNREFTKGLTFNDFADSYISSDRPDNRGIYLGEVVKVLDRKVTVFIEEDIAKGDGVEFQLINGKTKGLRSHINRNKRNIVEFDKIGNIKEGSKVYRTSSVELLEKAEESYEDIGGNYPIDMEITVLIGNRPRLNISFEDIEIEVYDDFIVEEAKKSGLTEDRLKDQLSKLGDTNYRLEKFEATLDDNTFLPVSVINELRRKAIEELDDIRSDFNNRKEIENYNDIRSRVLNIEKCEEVHDSKLSVRANTFRQFTELDFDKIDRVYIGFYEKIDEALEIIKNKNIEIYLWTDKILYKKDLDVLSELLNNLGDRIDGVSVSNIGTYNFIKSNYDYKIHGDIGLNIFNSYTLAHFRDNGVDSYTLSTELTIHQIRDIKAKVGGNIEILGYGYLPSMIIETCPMALVKECKDDSECETCKYSRGYGLKDRMNLVFKLERNRSVTTLYNAVVLMILDNLKQILGNDNYSIRLDFTIENKDIGNIQDMYYNYLNGIIDESEAIDFVEKLKEEINITNGHYYRGIM